MTIAQPATRSQVFTLLDPVDESGVDRVLEVGASRGVLGEAFDAVEVAGRCPVEPSSAHVAEVCEILVDLARIRANPPAAAPGRRAPGRSRA